MNDLLDSFLSFLVVEKGLSENTLESYGRDLKKFLLFIESRGITSAREIKYNHILDFLTHSREEGLTATTIVRSMVSVKQFFKYLL
ncbi:site-specific integrase, partial [Flavicella marina]|uniref:site-specific integrase n=1 Tax=Flavicella marina TaxID=1475951 RepID=UPI00186AD635